MKRVISMLLTISILLVFVPTISFGNMGDFSGNETNAIWYWPLHGYSSASSAYSKITSSYGYRGGSFNRMHYGIDIAVSKGVAVYPTRSGIIYRVDNNTNGAEGRCIIINHGDGYYSSYHHLSKVSVSVGQYVGTNSQIGAVGGSGYGSESYYGAHLHMQIHYGTSWDWNSNVNPCPSGYTRVGGAMQSDAGGYPVGYASISYSTNTYTEAPSKSIISIEKTEYAVDETVNFKFDTDGTKGCNVLWIYCPDGSTLYYNNLYDTYSLGFGMSGAFEALVETWNDVGSKSSERIKFHIGAPTYSNVSLPKNEFDINETITFTLYTDSTPNCNSLWIYYPDGSSKSYTNVGTSIDVKIDAPGNYEALVQAWNSIGAKSSERIKFHVGSPTYANIQLNKTEFDINETITFYLDTDATPNCNSVWIYYPDGSSKSYSNIGNYLDVVIDTPGNYEALVQAWNSIGTKSSNKIEFSVTNPKPDVGAKITFNANGGNCTATFINTDADGRISGTLPIATHDDKNKLFDGWYTAQVGGDKITSNTVFTQDTTVYAQFLNHEHSWSYNAFGNTLNATCSSCTKTGTVAILAEKVEFSGSAYANATVDTSETFEDADILVTYSGIDGTFYECSTTAPTNVGKYKASITLGEGDGRRTVSAEFEITKSTIKNIFLDVIAPVALANKQTTVSTNTGYIASISWNTETEQFGFNTAYTATVTLTADSNHMFANNLMVEGWNKSNGFNDTLVFTKTFEATRKEKLQALTNAPENEILSVYCADVTEAIAELPSTITYETECGNKTVNIEWICTNYNPDVNAGNTFTWSVSDGELANYNINNIATSGNIIVTNVDTIGITHGKKDKTITYNEKTYDVSQLFMKGESTGAVTYEIVGGTGTGTLNGTNLTITKAGTIHIKMKTAANALYAESYIIAILTVDKATGFGTVEMEGWTYGQTANNAKSSTDTNGAVTYQYKVKNAEDSTYSATKPTNAGTYTVKATFKETYLYKEAIAMSDFTIAKKTIDTAVVLAAPVKNTAPQTKITGVGYTASVDWSPRVTSRFDYNQKYTATIIITVDGNHTVTGVKANCYTVPGAKTLINEQNSNVIIVTYEKTGSAPSSGKTGGSSSFGGGGSSSTIANIPNNKNDFKVPISNESTVALENVSKKVFRDVHHTGHWAADDINFVVTKGLMKGTTEDTFSPDENLTRAMLVTILYRAEGEPLVNGSSSFTDIDMNAYYGNAVLWAKQNGIVNGVTEVEFAPNRNVTREQIAAIMHRYADFNGYDIESGKNISIISYNDFGSISDYAISSLQYVVGSGLVKGKSDSTLNPHDNATRAEIAAILHRFIEANK